MVVFYDKSKAIDRVWHEVVDKKFETTGITGHVSHDFSFIPMIENTFFLVCSLHEILSKLVFHKGLF